MGNKYRMLIYTLSLMLYPGIGHTAVGSQVSVNANIVASPCTVSAESISQDINLGKFWTSALAKAGETTEWTEFSIKLESCPPNTSNVIATFSGAADPAFPAYFQNTGSSQRVAIEIVDTAGGSEISNGKNVTAETDSSGNARFALKGRMISPQGGATSGNVTGLLEVNFTYR